MRALLQFSHKNYCNADCRKKQCRRSPRFSRPTSEQRTFITLHHVGGQGGAANGVKLTILLVSYVARAADDPSCQRHIKSFVASEPFEQHGLSIVRLQVIGNSFMMHQIRKMIGKACSAVVRLRSASAHLCLLGLVVALVRRNMPTEEAVASMQGALTKRTVRVPRAPGNGLFLERCFFDGYNKNKGKVHGPVLLSAFEVCACAPFAPLHHSLCLLLLPVLYLIVHCRTISKRSNVSSSIPSLSVTK